VSSPSLHVMMGSGLELASLGLNAMPGLARFAVQTGDVPPSTGVDDTLALHTSSDADMGDRGAVDTIAI